MRSPLLHRGDHFDEGIREVGGMWRHGEQAEISQLCLDICSCVLFVRPKHLGGLKQNARIEMGGRWKCIFHESLSAYNRRIGSDHPIELGTIGGGLLRF